MLVGIMCPNLFLLKLLMIFARGSRLSDLFSLRAFLCVKILDLQILVCYFSSRESNLKCEEQGFM